MLAISSNTVVLYDVLRFSFIAHDTPRNAEQTAIVPSSDRAYGRLVALSRQAHQVLVIQPLSSRSFRLGQWHLWFPSHLMLGCINDRKVPGPTELKITPPARHLFLRVRPAGPTRRVSEQGRAPLPHLVRSIAERHLPSG